MYTATLHVQGDPDELGELFAPELARGQSDRAKVEMARERKGVTFTVTAKDSVALRAHLLGITKLLTVMESAEKIGGS